MTHCETLSHIASEARTRCPLDAKPLRLISSTISPGKPALCGPDQPARHFRMLPGPFDSPESRSAFARLLLELEAAPHQAEAVDPDGLRMAELLASLNHAERHYRGHDGQPTSEIYEVKIVVRALRELHSDTLVVEFGPLALEAARSGRMRSEPSATDQSAFCGPNRVVS